MLERDFKKVMTEMSQTCIILSQSMLKGSAVYSIKHWSHNWRCYQPVLRINKIVQAERKREHILQLERSVEEISKARGKKYSVTVDSFQGFIRALRLTRSAQKKVSHSTQNENGVKYMTEEEKETISGSMVPKPKSIVTTPRSFISSKRIVGLESNKSKPSFLTKKAQAGHHSKVVSTRQIEVEKELQESHQKRQKEDLLISRAIKLEMQLGREPDLLDIMWYLDLNYEEHESIWDQLKLLYPNFDREYLTKAIPEMELAEVAA